MRRIHGGSWVVAALLMAACGGEKAGAGGQPLVGGQPEAGAPVGSGGAGSQAGTTVPAPKGCSIKSGFPGDEACLAAPDPSEGIQIHIGPTDYTDAAQIAQFVVQPGDEVDACWSFHTPNDTDVYYQAFELRGRPGTHHIINTMYHSDLTDGGFTVCRDGGVGISPDILSSLPSASKPYMPRAAVAPENADFGNLMPAHAPTQADLHYFNATDQPILREFWLNLYLIPKEQVKENPIQIRGMGGLSWIASPIPAKTHKIYAYTCAIPSDGRIVELLGHTHAHGIRETAWIRHASGDRTQVFEQYDYRSPQIFYYDSVAQNPAFSAGQPGAASGLLPVKAGDALDWECEVNNDSAVGLTYTNQVQTGEMCNIWGQSIGPKINCVLQ
jgi:hypothetical protein